MPYQLPLFLRNVAANFWGILKKVWDIEKLTSDIKENTDISRLLLIPNLKRLISFSSMEFQPQKDIEKA